ncbi:MAG: RNA polymerase sigma factor [Elusimicrobiaceae bacterium]|nr:RNA polymerase sigma factor [Elusimicrobiaceae bacterium]
MKEINEQEIIESVKSGNYEAFGLLVEKYKETLYSFIFYSTKNEAAAQDIYQDSLVKALTQIKNYQEKGNFKAWLFTIARNKVTDYFRANNKTVSLPEDTTADIFPSKENTEKEVLSKISLENILAKIEALPDKDREIILLRQYLSFQEISEVLNCPLGTALARLNRAIKKLQKNLGEEYAL